MCILGVRRGDFFHWRSFLLTSIEMKKNIQCLRMPYWFIAVLDREKSRGWGLLVAPFRTMDGEEWWQCMQTVVCSIQNMTISSAAQQIKENLPDSLASPMESRSVSRWWTNGEGANTERAEITESQKNAWLYKFHFGKIRFLSFSSWSRNLSPEIGRMCISYGLKVTDEKYDHTTGCRWIRYRNFGTIILVTTSLVQVFLVHGIFGTNYVWYKIFWVQGIFGTWIFGTANFWYK
jgi:hypothetical protein